MLKGSFDCKRAGDPEGVAERTLSGIALRARKDEPRHRYAPRRLLPAIVMAQSAGASPWCAMNAVMPKLQQAQGWALGEMASLSSAVHFGFIVGTLRFAVLALADR